MQARDNFPIPKMLHRVGRFISLPPSVIVYDVLSLSEEDSVDTVEQHTHLGKIKTHPGTIRLHSKRGKFYWMGSAPRQHINTQTNDNKSPFGLNSALSPP